MFKELMLDNCTFCRMIKSNISYVIASVSCVFWVSNSRIRVSYAKPPGYFSNGLRVLRQELASKWPDFGKISAPSRQGGLKIVIDRGSLYPSSSYHSFDTAQGRLFSLKGKGVGACKFNWLLRLFS
jgi:hypothetical protein